MLALSGRTCSTEFGRASERSRDARPDAKGIVLLSETLDHHSHSTHSVLDRYARPSRLKLLS